MRCFSRFAAILLLLALAAASQTAPRLPLVPAPPPPDARYKADILVVVAHPDDETLITGYLARAIFDQHKRVAVLFGTPGNAGGNVQGPEQAASLAAVREIEARRALASFGVFNVWFLGGSDTPGQNPLRSLETWNHGAVLERVVRLIRLTRPQIVLTWLPDQVVGEDHGDHQAASIIATEAFDLAGDPTAFPEQLAEPDRGRTDYGNLTEGLAPWQPEKLYYFTDATHFGFLRGKGPQYATTTISPSRHVTYARLEAVEQSFHLTQDDTGAVAARALRDNDLRAFRQPVYFVFGKSVLSSAAAQDPTADLFAGVVPGPVAFVPAPGYHPVPHSGVELVLGQPWNFYQRLWRAHGLRLMPGLLAPERQVGRGQTLAVPLLLRNATDHSALIAVRAELPAGWKALRGDGRYPVPAHGRAPVYALVRAPGNVSAHWTFLDWQASGAGLTQASVRLHVFVTP